MYSFAINAKWHQCLDIAYEFPLITNCQLKFCCNYNCMIVSLERLCIIHVANTVLNRYYKTWNQCVCVCVCMLVNRLNVWVNLQLVLFYYYSFIVERKHTKNIIIWNIVVDSSIYSSLFSGLSSVISPF